MHTDKHGCNIQNWESSTTMFKYLWVETLQKQVIQARPIYPLPREKGLKEIHNDEDFQTSLMIDIYALL